MHTYDTQPTTPLLALERQRDRLAERLTRLHRETDPHVVESFHYGNPADAARVRGRRMCQTLRAIDDVNRRICRIIAPGFAPRPSVGFSDRVMQAVGR